MFLIFRQSTEWRRTLHAILNLPNLESLDVCITSFPSGELPEMAKLSELLLSNTTDDVFETDIFCKALKKMPNLKLLCLYAVPSSLLDFSESLENDAYLRVCKEVFVTVSQTKNIVIDNDNDGTILKIYWKNAQSSDAEIETLNIKIGFYQRNELFKSVIKLVETHLKNHCAVIEDKEECKGEWYWNSRQTAIGSILCMFKEFFHFYNNT